MFFFFFQINASERRVLFTKWVGEAWKEISSNKDMIIKSFRVCGISLAVDGSEDSDMWIKGLENYSVGSDESGSSDEEVSEIEDPFTDTESDTD